MVNYDIVFQKLVDNGYEFDSSRYIKEGYELFKKNIGGFVGFFSIYMAVFIGLSYLAGDYASIFTNLLQPALTAGLLLVANEIYRGKTVSFAKFFDGFKFYLSLLLLSVVSGIIIVIGIIFLIVPGIYLAVSYSFAQYFIIFLGYDFWPAMELSRKIISKNWWNFLGFLLLLFLINLAGICACGVGVLFTGPATVCMTYIAFEDIIGGAIRKYSDPEVTIQPEPIQENQPEANQENQLQ